MRWLVSFALLLCCSSGFSWAQAPSSSSTGPLPEASAAASSSPRQTWERLDELLLRLESSAEASSADSMLLRSSLEDARSRLTELSERLTESSTRAGELSSSLERCERSLELSEASLKEARAASSRRELELWLWRGAAAVGLVAGAAGIGWGLSR
jgi:hypothetical protein